MNYNSALFRKIVNNYGMDFAKHLESYLTKEEISSLISSLDEKEHKGLILNPNKMDPKRLKSLFSSVKKHPFVESGFLYDQEIDQPGKKIYHEQGAYYIQDPSAAIVASLLPIKEGQRVLDLCAAPGGKTTQISLRLGQNGLVVANDLSKQRAITLLQNIERMGLGNVVVTSLDFKNIYQQFLGYFDHIILDAPCSGSGMFRRSEEMKKDWTFDKVLKYAKIQQNLIEIAYSMLKPGGNLIYSTCSYSYEEDEEIIEYLLEKTDAKLIQIPEITGNFRSKKYPETIHLFPHLFPGEGHYIALIKKPGQLSLNKLQNIDIYRSRQSKGKSTEIEHFVLPQEISNKLIELSLRPGLLKETKIDQKIIPSHHYSHACGSTHSIELTKEETIQYLQGNVIYKKNPQEGYSFVSYQGINLGVVHLVNNQLKNLYPKGLRIFAKVDDSF